uniref:Uncharacterized protein n=1 Tax=Oryza punctata TaxID=4537 RepID=A0A0E0KPX0_ORYPU
MEHSKKFIDELQKDSAADSGSNSEPLTAEAKTHLVVDGKKIQLQEEDSHQGSRSARDLIRFTLMAIRKVYGSGFRSFTTEETETESTDE